MNKDFESGRTSSERTMASNSKISFVGRLSVGCKLASFLIIIIFVIVCTLFYTITTIQKQKSDAVVIDIAGRQRMLNQAYMKEILLASQGFKADYNYTRKVLNEALEALTNGGPAVVNPETGEMVQLPPAPTDVSREKLAEQKKLIAEFTAKADEFLRLPKSDLAYSSKLKELFILNAKVHAAGNDAVKLLTKHSESKIATMIKLETVIGISVGLLGILLWWLSARGVIKPLGDVVNLTQKIAEGIPNDNFPQERLTITSTDEIGQMGIVFNQMLDTLVRNFTERKRAEEMLNEYAKRLLTLSHRLLEVQETERRHIARELHDEIGQSLTAVKINLQAMQRLSKERSYGLDLEECFVIVDKVLDQIRNLSLDLRPSMLDDLGLVAALSWHIDRQAQLTGLNVKFDADPLQVRLHPDLEIVCFRIAQEALTNVVRHAQAQKVHIELRQRGTELELVIRDDGVGFDVHAAQKRAMHGESLGLVGMQERARLVGGQIEIESTPMCGTTIRAHLPLTLPLSQGRQSKRRSL